MKDYDLHGIKKIEYIIKKVGKLKCNIIYKNGICHSQLY